MGVYNGPSCKKCRRARAKLYLKGERCHTAKCAVEKRNYPPGQRSVRPPKISEYARRLIEKQKMRFYYGVNEGQMLNYFKSASTSKGVTGHNLVSLFERRLDNIVFRAGYAKSRREARQLVKHGFFKVNKKKLDIPSAILEPGDIVLIEPSNVEFFKSYQEAFKDQDAPEWLLHDQSANEIKVQNIPQRNEVDIPVDEQLIVEFYSK